MSRTVIFDFDGTIANTLDAVVKIVNEHSEHFGYKKVTKQDIPYLQGKNLGRSCPILEYQFSNCLFGFKRYIQR
ncbi:MAG: HAD hydrolase-like protein [Nitrosopumilus sp.]